ncbi:Uncharacterized protein DAT39_001646 [Clarias magur]|uniref:Uncharacterized protein n=1 Tax=Clarias magur TaxID=1594786 RepID=A0A8J4XB48_CLAMG|nr:Uncharacterized protein DAT39_001646 [Clarias magur]
MNLSTERRRARHERESERAEKALMSVLSEAEYAKKQTRQREIHNICFDIFT